MLSVLKPQEVIDSVFVINPEFMQKRGLKALLLDIDNTLVPHGRLGSTQAELERVRVWIRPLVQAGVALRIVSNALPDRIALHARELGIKAVGTGGTAGKPFAPAFKTAITELQLEPRTIAMLGDQVFTDILGANKNGLYGILVRPLSDNSKPHTKIARSLERAVLKRYGIVW